MVDTFVHSSLWPLAGSPILPIVFIASVIDNKIFLLQSSCLIVDLLSCLSTGYFFPETYFKDFLSLSIYLQWLRMPSKTMLRSWASFYVLKKVRSNYIFLTDEPPLNKTQYTRYALLQEQNSATIVKDLNSYVEMFCHFSHHFSLESRKLYQE